MPLPVELKSRLLESLAARNLVTVTGAGLSRPAPSELMLAAEVAHHCYHDHLPIAALPADCEWDVDQLAGHFHAAGTFESYFINKLVPWGELAGRPNEAHAAIADFLLTGASPSSLTANFDTLVEQWCERHKVSLRGALDGAEAVKFGDTASPLLKFHGCMTRGREVTLWTHGQLVEPHVQQRVESCRQWMNLNLPGRDLLIVGFWTDWGYLNEVLAGLLAAQAPATVTVVDPATSEALEEKAPDLWATIAGLPGFEHVRLSSDEALVELRKAFSEVWIRRHQLRGAEIFEDETGGNGVAPALLNCPNLDGHDLYDLRRDAEGVSYVRAARQAVPDDSASRVAFVRLKLLNAGANHLGPFLTLNGRAVRVVNSANKSISRLRASYNEAPSGEVPDLVICAGATSFGTTENIVRGGGSKSVVRKSNGGESRWVTEAEAFAELGI